MTSSEYYLYYFNVPGRAEPCRLIFEFAGVPFVDVRLSSEDQKTLKAKGLFPLNGNVPVLQKGHFRLGQSCAIMQYLSKEFNMWPTKPQDDSLALSLCLAWDDLKIKASPYFYAKPEDKEKAGETFWAYAEQWQKNVSKILGEKKSFFPEVGITGADIAIFDAIRFIDAAKADFAWEPNLKALKGLILENAHVAKWIAEDQTKKKNYDISELHHHHHHHQQQQQQHPHHEHNHLHEHHAQLHQHNHHDSHHHHQKTDEKEALKLKIQLAELEVQSLLLQLKQKKADL